MELDLLAVNANVQVLRPPAAKQVALAAAEAAGIQPEEPEGQVPVQQVVNALNDGGGPTNVPALKVSCFMSFRRVFKFPLLAGSRFFFGRGQICSPMPSVDQLFVLFAPVWRPVCLFFPLRLCGAQLCFIFACGAISLYPSGDRFVILCLCGCKLFVLFSPVWRKVCVSCLYGAQLCFIYACGAMSYAYFGKLVLYACVAVEF